MDAQTSSGPIPQILGSGLIGMGNWRIKRNADGASAWHVRNPDRVLDFDTARDAMDHAKQDITRRAG